MGKKQFSGQKREQLATTDFVSLQIHYQVDAALIGGLKIQIGDRVVDSSIQNRLKRMKRQPDACVLYPEADLRSRKNNGKENLFRILGRE